MLSREIDSYLITNESDIVHLYVETELFALNRNNIALHAKDSVLYKAISGSVSNGVINLDVNPKLFRRWVCPYLQHGLLPSLEDLSTPYKRMHLLAIVEKLGLNAFAEHLKSSTKVTVDFSIYDDGMQTFDGKELEFDESIICPDTKCNQKLSEKAYQKAGNVINHFYSAPHYGKVTMFESSMYRRGNHKDEVKYGKIDCFMGGYSKK